MRTLISLSLLLVCSLTARTYTYDDVGRLTQVAYPSGDGIAYAYDEAGNLLSVTPLALPAAPSGLNAIRSPDEVVLSWVDNADNESEYLIYLRQDDRRGSTQWRLIETLPENSTQYTDTIDNAQLQKFEYRVVARNGDGESADSNIVETFDDSLFEILEFGIEETDENNEVTLILATIPGTQYLIEETTDMIRWFPSTLANADELFTGALDQIFLGNFDGDSTTVKIKFSKEEGERKFFRLVR